MDDRELVKRVLSGDAAAQRAFYDAHVGRIFRLAHRLTGDTTAARDCTQLAFIQLFGKLRSFRGEAALSTWVHAVATSVILQWRRKSIARRQRETDIDAATALCTPAGDFRRLAEDAVRRAIDALPDRYKTVVVMHDFEGYTHEEIARALRISLAASKARLSRAHKRLRASLAAYAGDWAYE